MATWRLMLPASLATFAALTNNGHAGLAAAMLLLPYTAAGKASRPEAEGGLVAIRRSPGPSVFPGGWSMSHYGFTLSPSGCDVIHGKKAGVARNDRFQSQGTQL